MRLLLCLLLILVPFEVTAQLAEETVSRRLDLKKRLPQPAGPFEVAGFKGRSAYQIACAHRLLPLAATIRGCIDGQRMTSGEFHGRLDFDIEPDGKLKSFTCRFEQLQACLMPHVLGLRFPAFTAKTPFQLQVLVASPGVQLGRRVAATPLTVYPMNNEAEQRAYRMAVGWMFSPWSQAISSCAELTDQQLGFGYRMGLEIAVAPDGRPRQARLELTGKLASRALEGLAACVTPFVAALQGPAHAGRGPVLFRSGSSTAGWGIR